MNKKTGSEVISNHAENVEMSNSAVKTTNYMCSFHFLWRMQFFTNMLPTFGTDLCDFILHFIAIDVKIKTNLYLKRG